MKSEAELPRISVVVPVYNSAVILPMLVKELHAVLPRCAKEFELILVNDASLDMSWHMITDLASQCGAQDAEHRRRRRFAVRSR